MTRTQRPPRTPPKRIEFNRRKYGRDLLIDAARVREMPTFITDVSPHALAFHDVLVVTRGRGHVMLDGEPLPICTGTLLCSLPGQVREWRLTEPLDGACLFFTEEFIADTFSDPHFLDRFAFLRARRPGASFVLGARERRVFASQFAAMQAELQSFRDDSADVLRALLYETLVLLNRWYALHFDDRARTATRTVVDRFRSLIERDFFREHGVASYAQRLGISPGHLNVLCRAQLRCSAAEMIRSRIVLEARRMLLYTDTSAERVADRLGFADPAYFTRFFKRETGSVPTHFRARHDIYGSTTSPSTTCTGTAANPLPMHGPA